MKDKQPDYEVMHICKWCNQPFNFFNGWSQYQYKITHATKHGTKTDYFCSYNCINKYRINEEDKKRKPLKITLEIKESRVTGNTDLKIVPDTQSNYDDATKGEQLGYQTLLTLLHSTIGNIKK